MTHKEAKMLTGDEAMDAQPLPPVLSSKEAALHCVGGCAEVPTDKIADTSAKLQRNVSSNPKDIAARSRCPLHLIPPIAEGEIAWVLGDGAAKYGRYNWRDEKISLLNYLGAMKRHINRILDGEDSDPESGMLHLAHVAATACIVMDALNSDCVIDDRPK